MNWFTDLFVELYAVWKSLRKKKTPVDPYPDAVPMESVVWTKENFSKAVKTKALRSFKVTRSQLIFDYEPLGWPHDGDSGTWAIGCFFVKRDGGCMGGKFDWIRPNQTVKGKENILGGYTFPTSYLPKTGDTVYGMLARCDGSERTNLAEGVWE